ncbi:hypothetical protein JCM19235_6180 [Vibrio maritimus]|uniref:Uncharacterized protein n=1 Tax=Vibrio maritimus TaxID=990268 RepID=A0A090SDN1_9VIBR|nr:hypothetical protein JCM19235_6180 [Vibrio maritimus]
MFCYMMVTNETSGIFDMIFSHRLHTPTVKLFLLATLA